MKKLLLTSAFSMFAFPVLACGDGGCEPPPPPVVVHDDGGENDYPQSTYLPCCIQEGKMVAKKWWPMRPEKVMKLCERELARNNPYIYECDIGGEKALK